MTTLDQARKAKATLLDQFESRGSDMAVGIGKDRSGYIVRVHAEKPSQKAGVPASVSGVKVEVKVTGKAKTRAATR
jgi:hypothetical protein